MKRVRECRLAAGLESRVERITESGCWIWLGTTDRKGYGYIWDSEQHRNRRAHRVSYELHRGPIPVGLTLDHKCRVRPCVNPWHLRPATVEENIFAPGSLSPSALEKAQTHCKRGHPLSGENLHLGINPRNRARRFRTCIICKKAVRNLERENEARRARRQA